ncbi:hypothetical protein J6I90_00960 [Pseudidiomarina sp. 1APP75-32.1]|uniref:Uncharacterized protein n=1 Tax=Pseudidiomarina terrestris TaxID=2820060 RepID=A0AAW7QVH5_9GAMM|nr:hypothetical protein [Pseudidiomarina sp. 1APP75-32.1]MDN7123447.1 hypothetical protein [Pseudidiomarina sp. 1APP75-32.1]
MSIWVRKVIRGKSENQLKLADDCWDLRDLFKEFERWVLESAPDLEPGDGWIVDIGFSARKGANGGGPILSPHLMRVCAEKGISIYLSEYDDLEENA